MKYLSFDIEATGLEEKDLIIEFAMIPFDTATKSFKRDLAFHRFIKCPPFLALKPSLNEWVIKHNKGLINKAHDEGLPLLEFKNDLETYFTSKPVIEYFKFNDKNKITLFGKSMNAIDLPFLNRDLGFDFMRKYFCHRVLDLSSVAYSMVDMQRLPETCRSGSGLMEHFKMGDVAHTALEDAINTAKLYFHMMAC